jgi:hypothetical protein
MRLAIFRPRKRSIADVLGLQPVVILLGELVEWSAFDHRPLNVPRSPQTYRHEQELEIETIETHRFQIGSPAGAAAEQKLSKATISFLTERELASGALAR